MLNGKDKKQGKDLLQTLAKKVANSVYGGNIKRDVNDQLKCFTDTWMKENYDDSVKECWPLKNAILLVKSKVDNGVDDHDIAK